MRFRLIPKSTTLDDLDQPLPTVLHHKVYFGAHHDKKAVLSQGYRACAAAVVFGLKFADNVHYKFKPRFESQTPELQT